ncbi:MAG: thiamine pyrophosphate-binding protein [Alphaproteobacteria bacterium]
MNAARSGGRILVDQLVRHGVDDVFSVPGESFLAVLDALLDAPIRLTTCRQEGGAAMMAEAVGRLTGRPGVVFVTRGPGATNAAHAVHIADHDSTPMILFIGQVARSVRGRGAFQEMDYQSMFGGFAKWVHEIDDAARVPEFVGRAFQVATSGRPGPVVLVLPEDMLRDMAVVADAPAFAPREVGPSEADLVVLRARLEQAEAPMVILGGSRWTHEARDSFIRFAERWCLPVALEFRRQTLFPSAHPNFAGDLGIGADPLLVERIQRADLLIAIGARLGDIPSQGYTLLPVPGPGTSLVHVFPDADEIGRVYAPAQGIVATPAGFAEALDGLAAPQYVPWSQTTGVARAASTAWRAPPPPHPGSLQMADLMDVLRSRLPDDAVVTNGAGNYAIWLHRYFEWRDVDTQLAPTSGSMGYGVPAAVAAKRVHPDRSVVALAGDGCFMMNGQEFATAVQHDLPIVVVVIDNGTYGTIRMHQERRYPGRVSGTDLVNPDFAALARAYGGWGETVRDTEEFAPALERALASGRPSILHCHLDPDAISPSTTLGALKAAAMANPS